MTKNFCLILLALCFLLTLGGEKAMGEELIAPEKMYELSGISEEEFPASDMIRIIQYYSLTEEDVKDMKAEEIVDALRSSIENINNDYSYLFEAAASKGEFSKENILRVAIRRTNELRVRCLLLDLEAKQYYYGDIFEFIKDIRKATETGEISADYIDTIADNLDAFKWGAVPTIAEVAGQGGLIIAIETSDGIFRAEYGPVDPIPFEAYNQLFSIVNK